jgi:hypothetical protein
MPDCQSAKAFVLDDSIKIRHGKKMPGVSSHFDHTLGRPVMGQQVLNLGYSCEHGFARGAEGISGRVKFLPLAWAGMPKTSFRKNSDSPLI